MTGNKQDRNFLTIVWGVIIWRRKENWKKTGKKEGRKRKGREAERTTERGDFKVNWEAIKELAVKGSTVAELQCGLREAAAHWHGPDDLTHSAFMKTQVSIMARTVSETWNNCFCSPAQGPPSVNSNRGCFQAGKCYQENQRISFHFFSISTFIVSFIISSLQLVVAGKQA